MIWDALQGLDVDLRDGRVPGYRGSFAPVGVLIHHTASASGDLPSLGICQNGRPDLPGPLCQVLIGRSGTVAVVTDGRANHAGDGSWPGITSGNGQLVGVEIENNGVGEPWPAHQIAVAAKVAGRLCSTFGDIVIGHKEWAPGRKIDPSFDMDGFRQTVRSLRPSSVSLAPIGDDDMEPNQIKDGVLSDGSTVDNRLIWTNTQADRLVKEMIPTLSQQVADLAARVAQIQVTGGQIDMDVLATKVADLLAKRLAS